MSTNNSKYTDVFFDLDHTLWDFERNAFETINELFYELKIDEKVRCTPTQFIEQYKIINGHLWFQYEKGEISKETLRTQRFKDTLRYYGCKNEELSIRFGELYIQKCPEKTYLIAYCHEILEYLFKKYRLHIITNGFEEVQHIKLEKCDIRKYFQSVITSEMAGVKKPHKKIFNVALEKSQSHKNKAIMVGDNLISDIIGAKNAGIDQVYFNPKQEYTTEKATFQIKCLSEMVTFL